jgi:DnaK suppressor protein
VRRTPGADSDHYRRLQELRREQREGLEARLRELRASSSPIEAVEAYDIEALSDNCSTTGIGAAIVEITSRTLQDIEGALQRLRSGKYGVCSECGAEIAAARLRAMPFAERCRDCQELADAHLLVLAA